MYPERMKNKGYSSIDQKVNWGDSKVTFLCPGGHHMSP